MNFHTDFMDNMQVEKVLNGERGKITLLKTVNHFFKFRYSMIISTLGRLPELWHERSKKFLQKIGRDSIATTYDIKSNKEFYIYIFKDIVFFLS